MTKFATAESTKPQEQSAFRTFEARRRPLYRNGPMVTPIGFGSYRVGFGKAHQYPECEKALELALSKGLNVLDTSANYGFGQSELLIGKVIKDGIQKKIIQRDQIVLISKVGYMQGPNMEIAKVREAQGQPFPEISKFGESTWHCIHPDFILDQIDRTLSRLGVDTLDVYLLHNPEYMLKKFEMDGIPLQEAQEIFYNKMHQSFECLEKLVQKGKIVCYGVSSNQMGVPEEEYSSISLLKLHNIAQEISTENQFKVIQLPLNWLEISPLFYEATPGHSSISLAQSLGIGVMTNRPFNAMFNDGLIRLTRPPQLTKEQLENLDEGMLSGFKNWTQLSNDLEKLAKEQLTMVPGYQDANLSQIVVNTLAWIPGVSCVLTGMRQPHYVTDMEEALKKPALPHAKIYLQNIYENLEFHL